MVALAALRTRNTTVAPSHLGVRLRDLKPREGEALLYLDWNRLMGVKIDCPFCHSNPKREKKGVLKNARTNFSASRQLTPIWGLDGVPQWFCSQRMVCPECKLGIASHHPYLVAMLPEFASSAFPVDPQYCKENINNYMSQSITDQFEHLLITNGSGDMVAKMVFNAMNRAYLRKTSSYYSYWKIRHKQTGEKPRLYLESEGGFITAYPPMGDSYRKAFSNGARSVHTVYGVSDEERRTREFGSTGAPLGLVIDHTFSALASLKDKQGCKAVATAASLTGEMLTVAHVKSTKREDCAHLLQQVALRDNVNPKVVYSDTCPNNDKFLKLVFGALVETKLGLFHFIQRITDTLNMDHPSYSSALWNLKQCIYKYHNDDWEAVMEVLQKEMTSNQIDEYQSTKQFKERFEKHLRKKILGPTTINTNLDNWLKNYAVTNPNPECGKCGMKEPMADKPLFSR